MDYKPDPSLLDVPLTPEEVTALLVAGGNALRSEAASTHFLKRVVVTLDDSKRRLAQAARDLSSFTTGSSNAGKPTTLSPADAVKFLSEDQQAQFFSTTQRQMHEHARHVKAEADQYRERIVAFIAQAQRAQAAIAAMEHLDPATRGHLDAMFNELLKGGTS